jgi:hypothetical protein
MKRLLLMVFSLLIPPAFRADTCSPRRTLGKRACSRSPGDDTAFPQSVAIYPARELPQETVPHCVWAPTFSLEQRAKREAIALGRYIVGATATGSSLSGVPHRA